MRGLACVSVTVGAKTCSKCHAIKTGLEFSKDKSATVIFNR